MTIKNNNTTTVSSSKQDNAVPFWFGTEEPFQVYHVLKLYEQHIKLNHQRPKNARSPWQFVGKVARKIHCYKPFQTLDDVYVYENRCVCQGKTMPLLKRYCFTTTWCRYEGVPQQFEPMQAIDLDTLDEQQKSSSTANPASTHYLYAFPEFSEHPEKYNSFKYTSSDNQYIISHAGNENLVLAQCESLFKKSATPTKKEGEQDDDVKVEEFFEDEDGNVCDPVINPFLNNDNDNSDEEDDVIITGSPPGKVKEDYFQALLAGSGSKKNSPCTPIVTLYTDYEFEFGDETDDLDGECCDEQDCDSYDDDDEDIEFELHHAASIIAFGRHDDDDYDDDEIQFEQDSDDDINFQQDSEGESLNFSHCPQEASAKLAVK